jgi:hypothetical protein
MQKWNVKFIVRYTQVTRDINLSVRILQVPKPLNSGSWHRKPTLQVMGIAHIWFVSIHETEM